MILFKQCAVLNAVLFWFVDKHFCVVTGKFG